MTTPIWESKRIIELLRYGSIYSVLNQRLRAQIDSLSPDQLAEKVGQTMGNPSRFSYPFWALVLAAQYYELFRALGVTKDHAVYEPGAGAEPPVLVASRALGGVQASYTTINLNQQLHERLTNALDAPAKASAEQCRIIQANALDALTYLEPGTFDVACFNHSINDILQTAVSEAMGMDTATVDWFAEEQQMIEWLAGEYRTDGLATRGKPELLSIISDAATLVGSGGHLIFYHCVFEGMHALPWFPWDLYCELIPLTRGWIEGSTLAVEEVQLLGVDPQWWMVLRGR
ncbi:MAG: hypothetical protein AAF702_00195 [Chloroflexota bacterium]